VGTEDRLDAKQPKNPGKNVLHFHHGFFLGILMRKGSAGIYFLRWFSRAGTSASWRPDVAGRLAARRFMRVYERFKLPKFWAFGNRRFGALFNRRAIDARAA
jgi:hypothetical protein